MDPSTLLITKLIEAAGSQGFAVLLMFAGIVYVVRGNSGLIRALNKEREERIEVLERSARECSEDRNRLHREMKELWERVFKLPPKNP